MFYYIKYKKYIIRKLIGVYNKLFSNKAQTLDRFLKYCSENIGYYKNRGNNIDNYEIINKETVKGNYDLFCKGNPIVKNEIHTAGTTGTPCKFINDFLCMVKEEYYVSKYFEWSSRYRVVFRGEKIFKDDESPENMYKEVPLIREMYVSPYHINEKNLKGLVEKLRAIKNACLYAYPSTAYLLAEYCLKNNEQVHFDIVATSSEVLFDYQADAIKKAFGCSIRDWYGQAERVAALYRCENGNYHEVEGYSHVEYIPVTDSTYEIIGTHLHNVHMPLVRYRTGDVVEISKEPCKCGNKGISISMIHGRIGDFIELEDKKITATGLYCTLFKAAKNIREAQLYQLEDRSVVMKIVRGDKFSNNDEQAILATAKRFVPHEKCTVEYVNKIEREKSGKFKYVINNGKVLKKG